jgi:hypothetical protein
LTASRLPAWIWTTAALDAIQLIEGLPLRASFRERIRWCRHRAEAPAELDHGCARSGGAFRQVRARAG